MGEIRNQTHIVGAWWWAIRHWAWKRCGELESREGQEGLYALCIMSMDVGMKVPNVTCLTDAGLMKSVV